MDLKDALELLEERRKPENLGGMARFGIKSEGSYGLTVAECRAIAKGIGKDHELALELWAQGSREARLIAVLVVELEKVGEELLDEWVESIDSWDVCDHFCGNLVDRWPGAYGKVREWARRDEEFVKRASYATIAWLASHDKKAGDERFIELLPIIARGATDERNYVKKAVSWALRGVGKRNMALNELAIKEAKRLSKLDSKSARWIARDTLRELTSDKVQERLRKRGTRQKHRER